MASPRAALRALPDPNATHAASFTPLKPRLAGGGVPSHDHESESRPTPEPTNHSSRSQPTSSSCHYRLACRLPAELRGLCSANGRLYHYPLSAQAGDSGWSRELSPRYIMEAGWLEGRCSPIDGGSYTLVVDAEEGECRHQQISFTVQVGLLGAGGGGQSLGVAGSADDGDEDLPSLAPVSTAVSWRFSGLDEDTHVLTTTLQVLEAEGDTPPRACLFFDGLELLLARATVATRGAGSHSVRLSLARLDGASDRRLPLARLPRPDDGKAIAGEAGDAMLSGSVALDELWNFEVAGSAWQGSGVQKARAAIKCCLLAEVLEHSDDRHDERRNDDEEESATRATPIGFARVPVLVDALLPRAASSLSSPGEKGQEAMALLRSILQLVAARVQDLPTELVEPPPSPPVPQPDAAALTAVTAPPSSEQVQATLQAVRGLFPPDNPFAAAVGAALLLSQQHWPVVVVETSAAQVLLAVYSCADDWRPLTPCFAARNGREGGSDDGSGSSMQQLQYLQSLVDRAQLKTYVVFDGNQGNEAVTVARSDLVCGLDFFSLLLAAGFDLVQDDGQVDNVLHEQGRSATVAPPEQSAGVLKSVWQSCVRGLGGSRSLLPLLHGGEDSSLPLAAASCNVCSLLLSRVQRPEGMTLRWLDESDVVLSSPALLSTILHCCSASFVQSNTDAFKALCQAATTTTAEDGTEVFSCLLALGLASTSCDSSPQSDESDCDDDAAPSSRFSYDSDLDDGGEDDTRVPIILMPVTLQAVKMNSCTVSAAGAPFLNPLLLAAPTSTWTTPHNCSAQPDLGWALALGQSSACLIPLPPAVPLEGEPGCRNQQLADNELLALDLMTRPSQELLSAFHRLAVPSATTGALQTSASSQFPPLLLTPLDRDQERLTRWWHAHAATPRPTMLFGPAGSGRTRALANVAANAVVGGGQVLYIAPDQSAADAFESMLGDLGLKDLATNLVCGPEAMRTLRERYVRLRERAGSRATSTAQQERLSLQASHQRQLTVLQRAKARLTDANTSEQQGDVNTQLSLRQYLDSQAACARSAQSLVAGYCSTRLLEAARMLTHGDRPELASASSALLSTDSTDDDCVLRTPEFTALVLLLSPVIIATPSDLAIWFAVSAASPSAPPLFDTTLIDDATMILPHEAARVLSISGSGVVCAGTEPPKTVLSRLRKRVMRSTSKEKGGSGSNRSGTGLQHANAYEMLCAISPSTDGLQLAGRYSSTAGNSRNSIAPSRLLPLPAQIERLLGSKFLRVEGGGSKMANTGLLRGGNATAAVKYSETRVGNNMDSAIKAVQAALGTTRRALSAETIEPLRVHLRAIRGGVVNIGEARDIALELQKIARAIPQAFITIVAMSTAQMHLLQAVCKAAPSASKTRIVVKVTTIFSVGATCRCDVLLVSTTYGLRSRVGHARGVSAQRLPSIVAALVELPRVQSVVFLSGGGADDWACSHPRSAFPARFGKALVQMCQPATQSVQPNAPPGWVQELHNVLRAAALKEDNASDDDWQLLQLSFRSESVPAIAHRDSLVMCHHNLSDSSLQLEERFCVLPQLAARWQWRHVHHVFVPLQTATNHELTSALMRDMCGLSRLLKLTLASVTDSCVRIGVERRLDSFLVPSDAIAGLVLLRTSGTGGSNTVISQTVDAQGDFVTGFVDHSSELQAACDYCYELRDGGVRGDLVHSITARMPAACHAALPSIQLVTVQSASGPQLLADVSLDSAPILAVKATTFEYELKYRSTSIEETTDAAPDMQDPSWQQMVSPAISADMEGTGLYEFALRACCRPGSCITVAAAVRTSMGQGQWKFASMQISDEEEIDAGVDDFLQDDEISFQDADEFSDDDESGAEMDEGGSFMQPAPNLVTYDDRPHVHTDVATGTISWRELDGYGAFEVHARPWDISAPAGRWTVVAKCAERRVITARQLMHDDGSDMDLQIQIELRVRGIAEGEPGQQKSRSPWTYTSIPINSLRQVPANMSTVELQLCPAKRSAEIQLHVGDLMMGGIMRLSARVKQQNDDAAQPSTRMAARATARLVLTYGVESTTVYIPLRVATRETRLNFKRRTVQVEGEGECGQWQASVRPTVSAPVNSGSMYWSKLHAAIGAGAQAQLELNYSAGAAGSSFVPIGTQYFTVQLQPYDPAVSGRLDLISEFVLPRHVLVEASKTVLLGYCESAKSLGLGPLSATINDLAQHCYLLQSCLAQCVVSGGAEVEANTNLAAALAKACEDSQLFLSGPSHADLTPDSQLQQADISHTVLLPSLLDALRVSDTAAEFRPFPSIGAVKLSILESLRLLGSSRPHLAGMACYLQYRIYANVQGDVVPPESSYKVNGSVDIDTKQKPITAPLPALIADLVNAHVDDKGPWDQHLSPIFSLADGAQTGLGVPNEITMAAVEVLVSLLTGGETVTLLDPTNEGYSDGWSFHCNRSSMMPDVLPCSSTFLGVGTCKPSASHAAQPLLFIPVKIARIDASVQICAKPGTNPFFNPALCAHLLPLVSGWGRVSLKQWAEIVLAGVNKSTDLVSSEVVLLVTSGERASDRIAESPILDVLQHHLQWSGTSAYGHIAAGTTSGARSDKPDIECPHSNDSVTMKSTTDDTLAQWQLTNPTQVGDADASQRHAIAQAVGGKSFVLRGPPGCGKTQTLANMVAALVAEGKTVCVVAKLPVALGVFAEKLKGMQMTRGSKPSLRPLTADLFTGKDGGKIRRGDDTQNFVTGDDRLQSWPALRDMGKFWSEFQQPGTESVVRGLLREGWRLSSTQPPFLHQFQCKGLVGVQLTKPKHKPKYACSLCGKVQASEGPFRKHMEAHESRELWNDVLYEPRYRYELAQWQEDSFKCQPCPLQPLNDHVEMQLEAAMAAKAAADRALHDLEIQAAKTQYALHIRGRYRCGHVSTQQSSSESACPGAGCCIADLSLYELLSNVANGAGCLSELQQQLKIDPGNVTAGQDLAFFTLACQFAECPECCHPERGCCHAVLETVQAVKGASHSSVFAILSLELSQLARTSSGTQCTGVGALQHRIYTGLQAVSTAQTRLRLRCALLELSVQLRYLRDHSSDGSLLPSGVLPPPAMAWNLETARRRDCLSYVSTRCETGLLQFLQRHPSSTESLEAAFGSRGGSGERARRLVELLYPAMLDASADDQEMTDPALLLRLLLKMYPVFCFTPEECARHLPAALPACHAEQSSAQPVFDVVLFDEASQLPTLEALGCLGRARQCIIVGDDQQLPPRDGCTGLLDDALLANMPLVPLTWHYRSAFRSLIHVSNVMFYGGSLQCVPSATDFLRSTACTGAGQPATPAGLVRQEVAGLMESNYVWRAEIEQMLNRRLRRIDSVVAMANEPVRYSATPQGFVNSEQAWRVLEELLAYLDQIKAEGRPMSVGIITLNRPQRQLIHTLVTAAQARLGLVDAHNHCFERVAGAGCERDQALFIQSIDQIQGEERELILFSMLLAPRRQLSQNGKDGMEASDEEDLDIFDCLEAPAVDDATEPEAEAVSEAHRERSSPISRATTADCVDAAAAPPRAQRFQYSTIAHAHGDRLLNVGLSRAIRVMRIFYHPRMVAPPEHDPKNGKRVFGWLVRYLLRQQPTCTCGDCTSLFRSLLPSGDDVDADDSADIQTDSKDTDCEVLPGLWQSVQRVLQATSSEALGQSLDGGCSAEVGCSVAAFGGGAVQLAVAMQLQRQRCSSPEDGGMPSSVEEETLALLADGTTPVGTLRERISLPPMLRSRKVGWSHCAMLHTQDLLNRLTDVPSPSFPEPDNDISVDAMPVVQALESWVTEGLHAANSPATEVASMPSASSLFNLDAAPVPVPGHEAPTYEHAGVADGSGADVGGVAAVKKKAGQTQAKARTVVQLKAELKRRGLKCTGRKAELEQRLLSAEQEEEDAEKTTQKDDDHHTTQQSAEEEAVAQEEEENAVLEENLIPAQDSVVDRSEFAPLPEPEPQPQPQVVCDSDEEAVAWSEPIGTQQNPPSEDNCLHLHHDADDSDDPECLRIRTPPAQSESPSGELVQMSPPPPRADTGVDTRAISPRCPARPLGRISLLAEQEEEAAFSPDGPSSAGSPSYRQLSPTPPSVRAGLAAGVDQAAGQVDLWQTPAAGGARPRRTPGTFMLCVPFSVADWVCLSEPPLSVR
jgi:hypothetical protein